MLKGQRKGESIYPMRRLCVKCGKYYIIRKHRRSKLCFDCASTLTREYIERRGEYYKRWLEGMIKYVERLEEKEKNEKRLDR